MNEPESASQKTFTLYPHHIVFLEGINENTSLALRTVLDSISNGEKQVKHKQILDTAVTYVSLGLICMLLSYIVDSFVIKSFCILIGAFLFAYGAMGGVMGALQRTKFRKHR